MQKGSKFKITVYLVPWDLNEMRLLYNLNIIFILGEI